ncbi:hypothetical protein POM88_012160 [Heracleum sosnowskyi]|uniref:Uncharacterized protein n=1 Tax=Heracleum sosnowskyi TaxID=360622 RepID=A0AAD8IXN1_9APIA|nr:hypothetical protein POM88_012160 [Heracleum sosnowskyi]
MFNQSLHLMFLEEVLSLYIYETMETSDVKKLLEIINSTLFKFQIKPRYAFKRKEIRPGEFQYRINEAFAVNGFSLVFNVVLVVIVAPMKPVDEKKRPVRNMNNF